MHAVRGNHRIGGNVPGDLPDDVHRWAGREPEDAATRMQALGAQPVQHGSMEQAEQPAPVDRVLRPAVAGGPTARFGPDALTVLVEHGQLARREPGCGQLVAEVQFGQLPHRVGQDVDAHADFLDLS